MENTNSTDCSKSRLKFPFLISLALFDRFSPVYIHSRLSQQLSGSKAAFGTTFIVTGSYRKARKGPEEGYWKDFHN